MSNDNNTQSTARPPGPRKGRGPMGGGPMGNMMPGDKAKDFKGSFRKLAGYLGNHKWSILAVCVIAVASTVFMIFGPKILGTATDELFTGVMDKLAGTGSVDFGRIGSILLFLVGLYGVSAALAYLQGFVMSSVTAKITYKLRNDIFDKMHRLPFGFYDKTTHGDVLSRITNDVDKIGRAHV